MDVVCADSRTFLVTAASSGHVKVWCLEKESVVEVGAHFVDARITCVSATRTDDM